MPALTADRNTLQKGVTIIDVGHGIAANAQVWAGGLVGQTATGVVAATSASLACIGVANERKKGSTIAGAETVIVRRGYFYFASAGAADAITLAEVGKLCDVIDDQTVGKTNGTRCIAGRIEAVDSSGVLVRVG